MMYGTSGPRRCTTGSPSRQPSISPIVALPSERLDEDLGGGDAAAPGAGLVTAGPEQVVGAVRDERSGVDAVGVRSELGVERANGREPLDPGGALGLPLVVGSALEVGVGPHPGQVVVGAEPALVPAGVRHQATSSGVPGAR